MILTKTHANILWKVLKQKKKHKAVSITFGQLCSWLNMVNVLNSLQLDETEVYDGVLASKYLCPTFIKDLFVPTTVTFSGTRKGTDFKSEEYHCYDPVKAGFITAEEMQSMGYYTPSMISGELDEYIKCLGEIESTDDLNDKQFCAFLSPLDFEAIGGLFLANFKKEAGENSFTAHSEQLGTFTDYADKMTTSKVSCKSAAVKYFPVLSKTDFYRSSEYRYEVEEMIEEWFRACCDTLLSNNS